MTNSGYTHVEVDANDSCPMSTNMLFKNLNQPARILCVRLYEGAPGGALYEVSGWSSEDGGTAAPAYAVQVEDSGLGAAFLVYGGDWGIRLRPEGSTAVWGLDDVEQWGETHLLLADVEDLMLVAPP